MLSLRTASATCQFLGTPVALQQRVTHLLSDIGTHESLGVTAHRALPCEAHVRLTNGAIEDLVKRYGVRLDTDLTPHDLWEMFITLALEGGATPEQVQ